MSDFANFLLYLSQNRELRGQRASLDLVRARLRDLASDAKAADTALVELWSEVFDLRLIVASLCRLLIDHKLTTADELRTLVERIDASDGAQDGVFRGDIVPGRAEDSQ